MKRQSLRLSVLRRISIISMIYDDEGKHRFHGFTLRRTSSLCFFHVDESTPPSPPPQFSPLRLSLSHLEHAWRRTIQLTIWRPPYTLHCSLFTFSDPSSTCLFAYQKTRTPRWVGAASNVSAANSLPRLHSSPSLLVVCRPQGGFLTPCRSILLQRSSSPLPTSPSLVPAAIFP